MLRKRGARLHPNSGAGSIKWDGSDEDFLYEVKTTRRSFTMNGAMLAKMFRDAVQQGKQPKLLVRFTDYDLVADVSVVPGDLPVQRRM